MKENIKEEIKDKVLNKTIINVLFENKIYIGLVLDDGRTIYVNKKELI